MGLYSQEEEEEEGEEALSGGTDGVQHPELSTRH